MTQKLGLTVSWFPHIAGVTYWWQGACNMLRNKQWKTVLCILISPGHSQPLAIILIDLWSWGKQTGMVYWLFVWTVSNCYYEQCKIKQFTVGFLKVLRALAVFIVFYIYFPDHFKYSNVITYANDKIIFISNKNVNIIETKLNINLQGLSWYFETFWLF